MLLQQPVPSQGRAVLSRRRAPLAHAGQERRPSACSDHRREATINTSEIIKELRALIVRAAPDPALAAPVRDCHEDELLDNVIPFSSVILLGVVVAVEDRFGIIITRDELARVYGGGGSSLRKLAGMIEDLQEKSMKA